MGYLVECWQSKVIRNTKGGHSLAVQWLGLCPESPEFNPWSESKIPRAMRQKQTNKNLQNNNTDKGEQAHCWGNLTTLGLPGDFFRVQALNMSTL